MMNFFRRGVISLYRQPIKSVIFLTLIFLLGMLTSGAISVRQAIFNTDQNLRRNMPAVATVEYAFDYEEAQLIYEETGEWPGEDSEYLTPDVIREIGKFPQVRMFDYSINLPFGVTGKGFTPTNHPFGYDHDQGLGVEFNVEGVSTVNFLEAREGFVKLIEGRSFNENELHGDREIFPALISSDFAEINGLTINSFFDVQVVIFDWVELVGEEGYIIDRDSPPLEEITFALEVIGIFDPILPNLAEDADLGELIDADFKRSQANHRIYVSNVLAEKMFNIMALASDWQSDILFRNFFMLNDPLAFDDFTDYVESLPGNWRTVDFSIGFREISNSMENIQSVVDFVLFMAAAGTLLLIGLLVLLFLYDRKHEIGVYLALGEQKRKITLQILTEVIPLTLIGMTFALLVGNLLAEGISREMLRQELASTASSVRDMEFHFLEEIGYRFELTHEEMLEAYEMRLDIHTVITFYIIGIGTVLIATLIPVLKVVRLNPKKVLM